MIIATIAAYIITIVAVLGLSVKFLWLFFILFMYRTYASLIPYEWFKGIGLENHSIYFITVLILSIATYLLMLRLTMDLVYVRFIILALLAVWVLYKFELIIQGIKRWEKSKNLIKNSLYKFIPRIDEGVWDLNAFSFNERWRII